MCNKHKWIIVGFAWMFLGAVLNILYAITKFEMSVFQCVLSWGMYGGFIMILIGVFAATDKKDKENK
ncbi:MAG: hypothetical protein IJZ55_03350 [Lachnospiraceae bacterium]|nr:hypothetical protein [Lachnospiraceae bacterium]